MKALYLRLHENRDDDLIEWLEGLEDLPYGAKSQAIKEALRRGIGSQATPASTSVTLDADAVREAATAAIAQSLDLVEIRRVVEAAVRAVLAEASVQVQAKGEEDEEDEMVDGLGSKIML